MIYIKEKQEHLFLEIRASGRCGHQLLVPGWQISQAQTELHQSRNVDFGNTVIRKTSQSPQKVEDGLKYGDRNQYPYLSTLGLSEVHDKGPDHTLRRKLRAGATPPQFLAASCSTDTIPVAPKAPG